MNFHYTVQTQKSFDDAVSAVESETVKAGFRVLHVHNVQETLKSKGFDSEGLKIVEVCNAKYAHELLQKDLKMSLFLPCRITVFVQDGKTYISSMNVKMISAMVPELDFTELADNVNSLLESIVNNAK